MQRILKEFTAIEEKYLFGRTSASVLFIKLASVLAFIVFWLVSNKPAFAAVFPERETYKLPPSLETLINLHSYQKTYLADYMRVYSYYGRSSALQVWEGNIMLNDAYSEALIPKLAFYSFADTISRIYDGFRNTIVYSYLRKNDNDFHSQFLWGMSNLWDRVFEARGYRNFGKYAGMDVQLKIHRRFRNTSTPLYMPDQAALSENNTGWLSTFWFKGKRGNLSITATRIFDDFLVENQIFDTSYPHSLMRQGFAVRYEHTGLPLRINYFLNEYKVDSGTAGLLKSYYRYLSMNYTAAGINTKLLWHYKKANQKIGGQKIWEMQFSGLRYGRYSVKLQGLWNTYTGEFIVAPKVRCDMLRLSKDAHIRFVLGLFQRQPSLKELNKNPELTASKSIDFEGALLYSLKRIKFGGAARFMHYFNRIYVYEQKYLQGRDDGIKTRVFAKFHSRIFDINTEFWLQHYKRAPDYLPSVNFSATTEFRLPLKTRFIAWFWANNNSIAYPKQHKFTMVFQKLLFKAIISFGYSWDAEHNEVYFSQLYVPFTN